MDVQEAFAVIGRNCLMQMRANQTGALAARDPEFLHQYRVGLRRLRSAFGLFRPVLPTLGAGALVREMRWLGTRLGPARDWDVFCVEILAPLSERAGHDPGFAALYRRCARDRVSCAAKVREAVASPRYAKFIIQLERFLSTTERVADAPQLKAFGAARLQKRDNNLRKIARTLDVSDPAQVHRMRVVAKKLRYASEFLQSLFPQKAVRDYARSLARLQDALGELNDCATGLRLLDSLPPHRSKADADVRGLVRKWLAARKERNLGVLAGHWDTLRRQKRYWKSALPRVRAAADAPE